MSSTRMEQLLAIVSDRAELDRIARPGAALAIWWRRLPEFLRTALGSLDLSVVQGVSIEIDADGSVESALRSAGYPEAACMALSADVDLLMRRHAALTGEDRLQVRLVVEEAVPLSRFRADFVTFRLWCTYVGPGMQWCCADGEDAICEVPTGAVAVFKGRMLLNPPVVLHRPSPIDGHRLVLAIDPVRDL